ncbi:MAG: DUF3472 domain-containing protein [Verrucomicrobiales bacterium]
MNSTLRLYYHLFASLLLLSSSTASHAGEEAAPSSHMVFDDQLEGDILINEVRVPKSGEAMYTYYETLGWGGSAGGYAGIQAHPKGHNYIFSIWDHKSHTAPIEAVFRGPGTLTENFGGEGTGLKSWNFELGWETDTWYTLVARCWPVGDHTYYGYWVRSAETGKWTHLVTMDVAASDAYFKGGTDAFIEDWLETGKNARTTHLRGGWKRKLDGGDWHPFGSAKYSVNSWDLEKGKRSYRFRTNWNGGVAKDADGEFYFMTAGGKKTKPDADNPSTHSIKRREKTPGYAPVKIESAKANAARTGGQIQIKWKNDPATLPQFRVTIAAFADPSGKGKPLASFDVEEPHLREASWSIPAEIDRTRAHLFIRCTDILDNESALMPLPID